MGEDLRKFRQLPKVTGLRNSGIRPEQDLGPDQGKSGFRQRL